MKSWQGWSGERNMQPHAIQNYMDRGGSKAGIVQSGEPS